MTASRAASTWSARRGPDTSFDPHLSLVYGTLTPELKAELVRELSAEPPIVLEMSGVHVWWTEGVVGEWRELAASRGGLNSTSGNGTIMT